MSEPHSLPVAVDEVGPGADTLRREQELREPSGFLVGLALSYFGVYLALMTPVMFALAFKLQHISGSIESATHALGVVAGTGAIVGMIAQPVVGRLSDRTRSSFGRRRPWILGGAVVGAGALGCVGLAHTVPQVLIAWCGAQAGFGAALVATQATIPDRVPARRLGVVSGITGVTTPLSILAGSALVTVLTGDLLRFLVPGVVAVVLVIPLLVVLEDPPLEDTAPRHGVREFLGSIAFDPRRHPNFSWVMVSRFLVMFGYAGIGTFFPFFLGQRFQLGEADVAQAVLLVNVVSVVCLSMSAPLGGALSDRIGKRRPFVAVAGLIMVAGLLLLAFAPTLGIVVVAQGIIGLGLGAFMSVDQALAVQVLPNPDDNAKDLGLIALAGTLPQSVGPAVAPAIISLGSATVLGGYGTWYVLGALACLAGVFAIYRVRGVR
ncbi:MFS transporter [Rhodococcus sp. NPDC055112]